MGGIIKKKMINLNDKKYQPRELTKEDLLAKYSEEDIFKNYIGDFELGEVYRSPIRSDDTIPSFNIFYSKRHGCLLFKDFAGKRGDCIRFVQALLGLQTYQDAINQIDKDMHTHISIPKTERVEKPRLEKASSTIDIVAKIWDKHELDWWSQFGITKPTLERYFVYPIHGYYLNKDYIETKGLTFAYAEYKDNNYTYKIYRPLATKENKWRTNHPYGVHQGYRQLPHSGEIMIVTKSLKDVMSIWENTDIPAIGVQSETSYIKDSVMDEYKFRFDKVLTLFDNDRQGTDQAETYIKLYDIPSIFIPKEYECKDFSDLVKKMGKKNAIEIFQILIK